MLPSFGELLTHAGFTLRGKRRASCNFCSGHDRTTVSYTEFYGICFRCGWKSSYTKLAHELGFLEKVISDKDRAALAEIQRKEKRRADFLSWQKQKISIALNKLKDLRIRARFAAKRLRKDRQNDLLWGILARFYHQESKLNIALDFFTATAVSEWLEADSTIEELVFLFNEQTRGNR